jgi:hypothetical protein
MSAMEAIINICNKLSISPILIIAIRPEDGSGKKWLYTIKGQSEQFISLI